LFCSEDKHLKRNSSSGSPLGLPFTVTVTDNQAPSITCAETVTINTTPGLCTGTTALTAPAVSDNCNESVFKNAINSDGVNDYMVAPFSGAGLAQLSVEFWFKKGGNTGGGIIGRI